MKKVFITLSALFLTIVLPVRANVFSSATTSTIGFKIKNAGFTVDGKFKDVKFDIFFDEDNISNCRFKGEARSSSVNTGIALRDSHLREKTEFFNASKYPVLSMQSTKVVKLTEDQYTVTWNLTIKGITKSFKSNIKVKKMNASVYLSTQFVINRNDWNVGGSSLTMGDNVTVNVSSTVK